MNVEHIDSNMVIFKERNVYLHSFITLRDQEVNSEKKVEMNQRGICDSMNDQLHFHLVEKNINFEGVFGSLKASSNIFHNYSCDIKLMSIYWKRNFTGNVVLPWDFREKIL